MYSREDHVVTVTHPDGTNIVEHSYGTRITTYTRQVQVPVSAPDSETGRNYQQNIFTKMFSSLDWDTY